MFVVVRSVFWLTAAYLVIKPGVDLPTPGELSVQAMARGSAVVAEQIERVDCETLHCLGGKMVVAAALPAVTPPPLETPSVPLPRPRPERKS